MWRKETQWLRDVCRATRGGSDAGRSCRQSDIRREEFKLLAVGQAAIAARKGVVRAPVAIWTGLCQRKGMFNALSGGVHGAAQWTPNERPSKRTIATSKTKGKREKRLWNALRFLRSMTCRCEVRKFEIRSNGRKGE